jgi:hypothetical protein
VPRAVEPGACFQTIVHLHHLFSSVPAGTSKLSVRWELVAYRGEARRVLSTATNITLHIPAASAERLNALRTRLMDRLADKSLDALGRRALAKQLSHCQHAGLLPVAFALSERDDSSVDAAVAIATMAQSSPQARAAVVEKLRHENSPHALLVLEHLATRDGVRLAADETARLLESPDVWVRAVAWASGDKDVALRSTEGVLGRLRSLTSRADEAKFRRLLRQLDSPSFRAREQASAELLSLGENALPSIREVLEHPLSAEQRWRLGQVRTQLEKNRSEPPGLKAIRCLESMNSTRSRMALEALAANEYSSWIAKEAKAALKRTEAGSATR